jgi:hypothetical protein
MSDDTLRALLNRALKSDEILEWLRDEDMEVIYDLDRLQEGSPDRYWAAAHSAGFQLCFNEDQLLRTIFCYVQADEGFSPIDTARVGVPIYWTFDAAAEAAQSQGLSYLTSDADEDPEMAGLWLRMDLPDCTVHYQFGAGELRLITLMLDPP